MITIRDLVRLVPPPAVPVDADGDWDMVEATLGLRLPSDFKALLRHYGLGQFDDIWLWTPFDTHTSGTFDLVRHARELVDLYEPVRNAEPEAFPYPLYPEPGGLLEWASDGDGNYLCWLTEDAADSWPVVVFNVRAGAYRHDVGAVELLYAHFSGEREVELLRPAPAVPWFDAYRTRTEVYVWLSEGELPYVERLRILREVLAPTADRFSHDWGNGVRQDEFKAVDRDWLLMYEMCAGHQIRVAFPPEDGDDARTLILEAARAMGCQVLGATDGGEPVWLDSGTAT